MMDNGLWLINEHGERIALWTEEKQREDRLETFIDKETDIERNTGEPRTLIVAEMMKAMTGAPTTKETVERCLDSLTDNPRISHELLREAAQTAYKYEITDELEARSAEKE